MVYYVNGCTATGGDGSEHTPFQTIQQAAQIAQSGDEIVVAPGVYREWVNPLRGNVVYRAEQPRKSVISGAEPITNWRRYQGDVWIAHIPNRQFGDYNPYTDLVFGDWYHSLCPLHTGEVYFNQNAMYEVDSLKRVCAPEVYRASWESPDRTLFQWYTEQQGDETVIYANFQGQNPNQNTVEINVRQYCFYPEKTGINDITLQGFVLTQAATNWAPPTAYQEGLVGPHWSKGWLIENCEISHSKCTGISLGKYLQPNSNNKWMTTYWKDGTQTERDAVCQAVNEGWSKETVGSHIIRNNEIHHCGQAGIAGHMGAVFSLIEGNHIHHINCKQDIAGAEIGGIKLHAAIDTIIRGNHIHDCTRGLWLDWQAQGTRVTQNLFHDNLPPEHAEPGPLAFGEDIFVEVSHGPTLIDHNLLFSPCSCRICAQGIALVHNLIAGSLTGVGEGTDNGACRFPTPRYTPYHVPHSTAIAGFMTIQHGDIRFYNNVFVQMPVKSHLADYVRQVSQPAEEHPVEEDAASRYFRCGTWPYEGYPDAQTYFGKFTMQSVTDYATRDIYYDHMPCWYGGNIYLNGALPSSSDKDALVCGDCQATVRLVRDDARWSLQTNLLGLLRDHVVPSVDTDLLGIAFEPEQRFEDTDGKELSLSCDYFGRQSDGQVLPGPFGRYEENEFIRL